MTNDEIMREQFRFSNPFVQRWVGEEEIWSEGEDSLFDVEGIHKNEFQMLQADIKSLKVAPRPATKVRFVVGASGSGKSHIFCRLRRWVRTEGVFCFASLAPKRHDGIASWILEKVILGLKHPCLDVGVKEYSQLHAMLYELIRRETVFLGTLDDLHKEVQTRPNVYVDRARTCLNRRLAYLPDVARALAQVTHPERADLAFRWLRFYQSL